ncbi:hypothetical protein ACH4FA_03835 [Streptomyces sp. NPDC017966]|uniref:hypothetical protein n=1 Tax=Streptomyces sp. NPDC017966 TaxID=3365023 RepID=UPI0037A54D11
MTTELVEKQDPTGKVLEIYAAAWMRVFVDVERVTHNASIRGRSGLRRQIDVCGYRSNGIVLGEAKDHQRSKLQVRFVDEFIGKMQDVEAVEGVLFSPVGFSSGAEKRAAVADPPIQLVTLQHGSHVPPETFFDVFCSSLSGCRSTVSWNYRVVRSESETQAGVCDRCGSVSIWCPVCQEPTTVFCSGDLHCGCGLRYSVYEDHADDSSIEVTLVREWGPWNP